MNTPPDSLHMVHSDDRNDASVHDKTVNKRYLVNKLNYLNFLDQTILISFRHTRYDNTISLRVTPLPCAGVRNPFLLDSESGFNWTVNPESTGH